MENIVVKGKSFEIIKELNNSSFVVARKDKKFVLRRYENQSEMWNDLQTHKKLKKYGINIPKLIKKYKDVCYALFEFVSDTTMLDVLLIEDIPDASFKELFNIYRFCRFSEINLNYLPENFAMKNGRMYYLSHDLFKGDEEINLENHGLYFWIYSPKLVEHLKELGLEVDKKRMLTIPESNKKIVLISVMHW